MANQITNGSLINMETVSVFLGLRPADAWAALIPPLKPMSGESSTSWDAVSVGHVCAELRVGDSKYR